MENRNGVVVYMSCQESGEVDSELSVISVCGGKGSSHTIELSIANRSTKKINLISCSHFHLYDNQTVTLSDRLNVTASATSVAISPRGGSRLHTVLISLVFLFW